MVEQKERAVAEAIVESRIPVLISRSDGPCGYGSFLSALKNYGYVLSIFFLWVAVFSFLWLGFCIRMDTLILRKIAKSVMPPLSRHI
jgi:hypothetical protein